jgi:DNA-directed RNA polymerase subunit beta
MVDRTNFGKLWQWSSPPDLIEIQTAPTGIFCRRTSRPTSARIRAAGRFKEVFPIESYDGRYVLDFVKYELSEPKLDP